jgi:hypothetical protein
MRNTTRRPRENRTITVDFQNEATYCQLLGDGKTFVELVIAFVMALASPKPTVSPAKNSLMYFVSMGYIGHPVWGSHREEAKRGPPSGRRIPRNEGVMMSLLHPYATPGLSLSAGGSAADAGHDTATRVRGSARAVDGGVVDVPLALHGSPHAPPMTAQRVARFDHYHAPTAYHRRSYAERYSRYRG